MLQELEFLVHKMKPSEEAALTISRSIRGRVDDDAYADGRIDWEAFRTLFYSTVYTGYEMTSLELDGFEPRNSTVLHYIIIY